VIYEFELSKFILSMACILNDYPVGSVYSTNMQILQVDLDMMLCSVKTCSFEYSGLSVHENVIVSLHGINFTFPY